MTQTSNAPLPPQAAEGITRLLELFKHANAEQKEMIRSSLGVSGGIKRKARRQSNADARQLVSKFGEAIHGDDFEVAPPSGVSARGAAAVREWYRKREENQGISDAELDAVVEAAKL